MSLDEKRYEFVTQQVRYFNEKILEAFALFIKLSLTIVGGFFWFYIQCINEKTKERFGEIVPWLIPLAGLYTILIVWINLTTQWGFRKAESDIIGTEKLPYPNLKSCSAEFIMTIFILGLSWLGWKYLKF